MNEARGIINGWVLIDTTEDGRPRLYARGRYAVRLTEAGDWMPYFQPNKGGSYVPVRKRFENPERAMRYVEVLV